MHQSGHSRAHSMQTVQFSASRAITPRERGGRSGSTSGYCWVTDRLVIVLNVTASPLISPLPGGFRSLSSVTRPYPARSVDIRRAHPRDLSGTVTQGRPTRPRRLVTIAATSTRSSPAIIAHTDTIEPVDEVYLPVGTFSGVIDPSRPRTTTIPISRLRTPRLTALSPAGWVA